MQRRVPGSKRRIRHPSGHDACLVMIAITELRDTLVLVTGATGFIGSHLVRRLVAIGARVTSLAWEKNQTRRSSLSIAEHNVDLRDAAAVWAVVQTVRPTLVFHLAAIGVTEFEIDPITAVQVNVEGTLNLLTALKDTDYHRFLFVGTSHEYGNNASPFHEDQSPAPANVYAASKSAAWLFCKMYHRAQSYPVVAVRPFGVYGPEQQPPAFLPALIQAALRGHDFSMTHGEQLRDLVYVQDVIEGMLCAATTPNIEGQVFNLCSGRGISLAELAQRVMALMGNPIHVNLGALPYRPGQIWRMIGDNSRAKETLGWQPRVSLDEGLRRTIAWCTANEDLY